MVDWLTVESASLLLLLIQVPATAVLLSRLLKGPSRRRPIEPQAATPDLLGSVSVVVPTLNEADRIEKEVSRRTTSKKKRKQYRRKKRKEE